MATGSRVRVCRIIPVMEKSQQQSSSKAASLSNGMMKEKRKELKERKHQGRQEVVALERSRDAGRKEPLWSEVEVCVYVCV